MKTTFFKMLSEIGVKNVNIEIKTDEAGLISVLTSPKSTATDSALKSMTPLLLTGTPEELDAEYFSAVSNPLRETQKFFSNVESYEKSIEEAKAKTAQEKNKKEAEKKAKQEIIDKEKKAVAELVKFTETLKLASDWAKKQDKVKELIDAVLAVNESNAKAKATKKFMEIQIAKASMGDGLFGAEQSEVVSAEAEAEALSEMQNAQEVETPEAEPETEDSEKEESEEEGFDHENDAQNEVE